MATTAPTKRVRKDTQFKFEVVNDTDAAARRSRTGQRRSKYSAIGDQVNALKTGEVLTFQASKNEVQGIRNYMRRNFQDAYKVHSRSSEGGTFEVHIAQV